MVSHGPMINRLVMLGATGDLAGRFLLPAVAALHRAGHLDDGFKFVGAGRADLSDDGFRHLAEERLSEFAFSVPLSSREAVVDAIRYRRVDVADPTSVKSVVSAATGDDDATPIAVYLALPPGLFAPAIAALGEAGLAPGSRVAVEKPFGRNRAEACELNNLLAQTLASVGPSAAYRVDHVLGMTGLRHLIGFRFKDPLLSRVWNGDHIEAMDVLWEEDLALEGRAGYYDKAGALQDVVQSHVLQVLSLAAMERPESADIADINSRQVEVLRSMRLMSEGGEVASRRARYTAGTVIRPSFTTASDRPIPDGDVLEIPIPGYADEEGVDPDRQTETFVELVYELDSPSWIGTRFTLRAGKALSSRRKGVVVRFRSTGGKLQTADEMKAGELWIGIDDPNEVRLDLVSASNRSGADSESAPAGQGVAGNDLVSLSSGPIVDELPPYARVLRDILSGTDELCVPGEVAEESWNLMDRVVESWDQGIPPLETYPAGSRGPGLTR